MKAEVVIEAGIREDFFRRHRKGRTKAAQAWKRLVAAGPTLAESPFHGDQIQKSLIPRRFEPYGNLWRIALPQGFRALYTVIHRPGAVLLVAIQWIGDHKEYDELFGDSTS